MTAHPNPYSIRYFPLPCDIFPSVTTDFVVNAMANPNRYMNAVLRPTPAMMLMLILTQSNPFALCLTPKLPATRTQALTNSFSLCPTPKLATTLTPAHSNLFVLCLVPTLILTLILARATPSVPCLTPKLTLNANPNSYRPVRAISFGVFPSVVCGTVVITNTFFNYRTVGGHCVARLNLCIAVTLSFHSPLPCPLSLYSSFLRPDSFIFSPCTTTGIYLIATLSSSGLLLDLLLRVHKPRKAFHIRKELLVRL